MPDEILNQGQGASPESMIVPSSPTPAPAGDGQGGTPAPAPGAQPQAPAFNPSEWNLNYKGRPISVRDRQHLESLATKGYGFDQEINRLKQRETELNEMGMKYQRYGQLEEALSKNPALAQKIFQIAQNPQAAGGDEGGEDEPPYVSEMRRELQEIKAWRDQLNNRNADQELDKEMDAIKKAFPQHDWDFDDGHGTLAQKILQHAHNNGNMFPSLQAAYRDFFWDNRDATIKADTLKAEQERIAREKAAGKVGGPGGAAPAPAPKPGYTPDKSYNDLAALAAQRIS